MKLVDKQKALDEFKWKLSVDIGHDACGEFDYCSVCDKTAQYPCARAFNKFEYNKRKQNKKKK